MKKLIIAMLLVSTISTAVNAQEKPSIKESAEKAKVSVDKSLSDKIFELTDGSKVIKYASSKSDTLTVLDGTKYVVIKGVMYPVSAFTQTAPIFLPADAWLAVLEIINTRKYGDIPVTTISQIIQAIGQQIPQKGGGQ